ncbi:MAG: universal stress protein [Actinobacteria bacterium]|jgi:nucleotide-binding universal stress UspA family protein|nr:universal stress protein [Actinomycetota bacterium]
MTRIVVGVDGSPASRQALSWAAGEAALRGAVLDVVHVHDPTPVYEVYRYPYGLPTAVDQERHDEEMERYAVKLLAEMVGELDQRLHTRVEQRVIVSPRPARALLEHAAGADLLVLGSRGHGGFAGLLLGSVSNQCVHHATCPVVVVPEGKEGP